MHMHTNAMTRSMRAATITTAIVSLLALSAPIIANAQVPDPGAADQQYGLGSASSFRNVGIGKNTDLKKTIATIINIALGFLGIIAVIIILAGGFKWMTAGGNEDQVGEARKMITGGIIGLVVIFAAWAIASFVITNLQDATKVTTPPVAP